MSTLPAAIQGISRTPDQYTAIDPTTNQSITLMYDLTVDEAVASWQALFPSQPVPAYPPMDTIFSQVFANLLNVYDPTSNSWAPATSTQVSVQYKNISPIFDDAAKNTVNNQLLSSNMIVLKAQYLNFVDEPEASSDYVIDISQSMTPAQIAQLKMFFSQMPRSNLKDWFNENILPSLSTSQMTVPGPVINTKTSPVALTQIRTVGTSTPTFYTFQMLAFIDHVYLAFIHFFNESNVEFLMSQGTALTENNFWAWEKTKYEAVYASNEAVNDQNFSAEMNDYLTQNIPSDPQAQQLIDEYNELPPAGDPGLELSRQSAINALLQQKEYDTVQAVIDSYRYVDSTVLGDIITQPVPFDVATPQGIVRATASAATTSSPESS